MQMWKTTLHLNNGQKSITTRPISIRRGIFQGDSISTLWFCLGLNPLSRMLNNTNLGYKLKNEDDCYRINHQFYVDDLKLYASSPNDLKKLLNIVTKFSNDITMEFGMDKCKSINLAKGKLICTSGFEVNDTELIKDLTENESYKYLGFLQLRGINHTQIKDSLTCTFKTRINRILKTQLNAGNKRKAINSFAFPALTYSFGLIKWSNTDLNNIARILRTTLTKHRLHHPKASIERMVLPPTAGGRGYTNIQQLHEKQIRRLQEYFKCKANDEIYRVTTLCDKNYTPLNLSAMEIVHTENSQEELLTVWKQKELHGAHANILVHENVDKIASNLWLKEGLLYGETEGFITAIQDRVIATRNHLKYIIKTGIINDKCRRCGQSCETIEHITAGCSTLASVDYLKRHNNVAKIVHQSLALKSDLINKSTPYYKYEPPSVLENQKYKLYWDRSIITDRTINANRPDIILIDKSSKTAELIDIATPLSTNLQKTYSEKVNKYVELAEEIKNMWHLNTVKIRPLIISATGVVPKTLMQHLEELKLKHQISLIQRSTLLDTCHLVRRFMSQ
jgi:hypothetical protein